MALISTLIDKEDSFEIIRDEIAAILAVEIANQKALAVTAGQDPDLYDFTIFTERANPWEIIETEALNGGEIESQMPLINVFFDQMAETERESNTIESQKYEGSFVIDCVAAKNTVKNIDGSLSSGDELSARELNRIIRLVRNIIMSDVYTYLGIALRTLGVTERYFQQIQIFQPNINDRPAEHVIVGRMSLRVKYPEFAPQVVADPLEFVSNRCTRGEDGELYFDANFDYTI